MKLENIKHFYRLLRHEKQTEIRGFKLDKDFKTIQSENKDFFVSSEEEFISRIKELNGKYNLYAGLNERTDKGKRFEKTGNRYARDSEG